MQETHDPSPTRPMLETGLVLIVEDEGPIAETLSMIVEEAGYTPVIATNGKIALQIIQQRWPAMVLTDLMMPVLNGTQMIKEVLALVVMWHLPRPPIVLLTAAGEEYGENSGADTVLSKPFELHAIDEVLHRFLPES